MANRNAARHLLLVVSVLLCFFVYMGYRLRGSDETADGPAASVDVASLTAQDGSRPGGQTRLMTMNDNVAGEKSSTRPPIATPSTRPPAMAAGENIPDVARSVPTARADDLSLTPPAAVRPPPSGSLEESARPTASSGEIVGLVPAIPVNNQPVAATTASANANSRNNESAPTLPSGLLTPPGGGQPAPAATQTVMPLPITGPTSARTAETSVSPAPPAPAVASAQPSRTDAPRQPAQAATPPARQERVAPPAPAVPAPRREAEPAPSESLRMYVVRPGDTLSRIAANELGSISLADNIFLLNRDVIPDPDHLMVGVKIRLPIRDAGNGTGAVAPRAGETAARPSTAIAPGGEQVRVHTVARGETLSSISLRYYGSSSGWRSIYEANARTVKNPNQLSVGTELVIPPLE